MGISSVGVKSGRRLLGIPKAKGESSGNSYLDAEIAESFGKHNRVRIPRVSPRALKGWNGSIRWECASPFPRLRGNAL